MRSSLAAWAMASLVACGPAEDTGEPLALEGPELHHTPPDGVFVEGDTVLLEVTAQDPDGLAQVRLFHREAQTTTWSWVDLDEDQGAWGATVTLSPPALEYYFKSTDGGDPPASSYLPEGSANEPFTITVLLDALDLPFEEEFEPESSSTTLWELGWISYTGEFAGYPWHLTSTGCESGSGCARHAVGNSNPSDIMDDWLISPALDFSSLERIQVTWWEKGTNVDLADHGLHLSTGSKNPDHGDYEEVALLPAPGTEWGRSAVYDLSGWAGEPVVYLAWRYLGAEADGWWIDSLRVGSLEADLSAALSWVPDVVMPGDPVEITVEVDNATEADAADVEVHLLLDPDGDWGVTWESTWVPGDVPALTTVSEVLALTLPESAPENVYVPLDVTITSGDDVVWHGSWAFLVGQASVVTLDFELDESAMVEVSFGVGEPSGPAWEQRAWSGLLDAGSQSVSLDVTDRREHLPPDALSRWYARLTPQTTATVHGLDVNWGSDVYGATALPSVETVGVPVIVYIPEPPDFDVLSFSTIPSTVAPGDEGVRLLDLRITNTGGSTSGPVTATLATSDPDVTLREAGPLSVAGAVWEAGQTLLMSGAFSFDVSASRVNSRPVELELHMDDGVELFTVDLQVEVPWPVFRIMSVTVDDSDGDGDGILDPGEGGTLQLTVANAGGLSSDGIVRGTLSVADSSVASATVSGDQQTLGSISVGSSRTTTFEVSDVDGLGGDPLDLRLELVDGRATYQASVTVVLGEVTWNTLSRTNDPTGDVMGGYAWDWVNGAWRVTDDYMEINMESAVVYDPSTLFLEAWASGTGARYTWYRLVLQSGVATLQGYTSSAGFTSLASPDVTFVDDYNVILGWDLDDMQLGAGSMRIGLAAGWCGPPEYYCDHFPDGWGYPYESFSSSDWFDMNW